MAVLKAYSFAQHKIVKVQPGFNTIKRLLPNGNIVSIVKGKDSKGNKVAVITQNVKPKKPCPRKRTITGACPRPKKRTVKKTAKK